MGQNYTFLRAGEKWPYDYILFQGYANINITSTHGIKNVNKTEYIRSYFKFCEVFNSFFDKSHENIICDHLLFFFNWNIHPILMRREKISVSQFNFRSTGALKILFTLSLSKQRFLTLWWIEKQRPLDILFYRDRQQRIKRILLKTITMTHKQFQLEMLLNS